MIRFLLPIILAVAGIGLFMMYTNPTYQSIKTLSVKKASYDEALDKSKDLKESRDKLLSRLVDRARSIAQREFLNTVPDAEWNRRKAS